MDIIELNRQAWEGIAAETASPYMSQPKYREMFEQFLALVPAGGAVVDLGCGPGVPVTRCLADAGLQVTAVDFSEKMIETARRNVPEARFVEASLTDFQADGSFDGAVSSYSLLCLDPENLRKAARNIIAALKPGGYCFIAVNEPGPEGWQESDCLCTIGGFRMYSRAYTAEEIQEAFQPLSVVELQREIVDSEMYGREYSLILLLRNDGSRP
jgi:SAM-dependent methyltransferase